MSVLTENEIELLSLIQQHDNCNQRFISQQLNLSLGLINQLIQRLKQQEMIAIERINQKKIHYFLTDKGTEYLQEDHIQRAYQFQHSLTSFSTILQDYLEFKIVEGERFFYYYGDDATGELLRSAFKKVQQDSTLLCVLTDLPSDELNGLFLTSTSFEIEEHLNAKNLMKELTKFSGNFLTTT